MNEFQSGIIAVENTTGKILHFVGLEDVELTAADFEGVESELETDPEFKIDVQYVLLEAPPEIVKRAWEIYLEGGGV